MTEKLTVFEAWSKVMEEVQSIGKTQRNQQQGYTFRGIDAVMNVVGPSLRTHGVIVVPAAATASYRDVSTSNGKPSREVTVMVTYRVYGPAGDSFEMQAPGESMDVGDKGTPKAMSVAYRTVLLQALTIPTDEPDPDSHSYERAPEERVPAADDHAASLFAMRRRLNGALAKAHPGKSDAELGAIAVAACKSHNPQLDPASVADLMKLAQEMEAQA